MFVREKRIKGYTYLYLVETVREDGRTKQRIIRNLGRKEAVLEPVEIAWIGRFPGAHIEYTAGNPDRRGAHGLAQVRRCLRNGLRRIKVPVSGHRDASARATATGSSSGAQRASHVPDWRGDCGTAGCT